MRGNTDVVIALVCGYFTNILCVRKTAITPSTTTIVHPACPKCGTNKQSGKTSCCFSGGTWFKKCGDSAIASNSEHTWAEGIQACKVSFSGEAQGQTMLRHQTSIVHQQILREQEITGATTVQTTYVDTTNSIEFGDTAGLIVINVVLILY